MDKNAMLIYIPVDLDTRFREFIVYKYRKYERGLLSHEVEEALRYWINLHTKAQKTLITKHPNPTPKVSKAFIEVKRYLLSKYYDSMNPGKTVPKKHFVEAIMNTRGSDKRTVFKWLHIFERMGLTKLLTGATIELL